MRGGALVAAVTLSVMVEERGGGKEERDISQGGKEVGE